MILIFLIASSSLAFALINLSKFIHFLQLKHNNLDSSSSFKFDENIGKKVILQGKLFSSRTFSPIIRPKDNINESGLIIDYIQMDPRFKNISEINLLAQEISKKHDLKFESNTTWSQNIEIMMKSPNIELEYNKERIIMNFENSRSHLYEEMILKNIIPMSTTDGGSLSMYIKIFLKNVVNLGCSIVGASKLLYFSATEKGLNSEIQIFTYGELSFDKLKNLYEITNIEFLTPISRNLRNFINLRCFKHFCLLAMSGFIFYLSSSLLERLTHKLWLWKKYDKSHVHIRKNEIADLNVSHPYYITANQDYIQKFLICSCNKYVRNIQLFPCLHVNSCFYCFISNPLITCSKCNSKISEYCVLRYV